MGSKVCLGGPSLWQVGWNFQSQLFCDWIFLWKTGNSSCWSSVWRSVESDLRDVLKPCGISLTENVGLNAFSCVTGFLLCVLKSLP